LALSVEKAVQRLKAEIIAPDWRLSARRVEALKAAFATLGAHFHDRQGVKAILVMAANVLQYIEARGAKSLPDAIDLLKEAMAGIVTLHEESLPDPEREEAILHRVHSRFQKLKNKIRSQKMNAGPAAASGRRPVTGVTAVEPENPLPAAGLPEEGEKEHPVAGNQRQEAARLMAELQDLLLRAEKVGSALRQLLEAAQATAVSGWLAAESPPLAIPPDGPVAAAAARPPEEPPGKECPPTTLREIVIGEQPFAIPEEGVALIRPLTAAARQKYLRDRQVPLRDFQRMFHGLSRQFRGVFATVDDRKLKEMVLPVIIPRAFGSPESPDEQAATLLVLSHGNWHGVLLCTAVPDDLRTMLRFQEIISGDLGGIGFLENGGELPVIDLAEVLRRQGLLLD
jgi:hypothetical protein